MISLGSTRYFGWLAIIAGALAAGCGGATIQEMCDQVCACEGCDAKTCVSEQEVVRKKAESNDCAGDYDAFVDCASSKLVCEAKEASYGDCAEAQLTVMLCVTKAP